MNVKNTDIVSSSSIMEEQTSEEMLRNSSSPVITIRLHLMNMVIFLTPNIRLDPKI